MALEDAVCIAEALGTAGEVPLALQSYADRRIVRTARVQLQSRAIGEHIYHPAGAYALARNKVMRAKAAEGYYDALAWLYGGPEMSARTGG